jgi:hypothetical protein
VVGAVGVVVAGATVVVGARVVVVGAVVVVVGAALVVVAGRTTVVVVDDVDVVVVDPATITSDRSPAVIHNVAAATTTPIATTTMRQRLIEAPLAAGVLAPRHYEKDAAATARRARTTGPSSEGPKALLVALQRGSRWVGSCAGAWTAA